MRGRLIGVRAVQKHASADIIALEGGRYRRTPPKIGRPANRHPPFAAMPDAAPSATISFKHFHSACASAERLARTRRGAARNGRAR